MNVIKTKIVSLKLSRAGRDEAAGAGRAATAKQGYRRRFSVPYGQIVESWKAENVAACVEEEEEYPIYQSASFKR